MTLTMPPESLEHKTYLINGELLPWSGDVAEVVSPILEEGANRNDEVSGVRLGSAPDMDEASALSALEAARGAYYFGRGDWPTADASVRIEAMEKFIGLMVPKREEVVSLLMWEICKKRSDA